MVDLPFRKRMIMLMHSIKNPFCIIILTMALPSILTSIFRSDIILLILGVILFFLVDLVAYDMPRTLLFAHDGRLVKVAKVLKEVPNYIEPGKSNSHYISNWNVIDDAGDLIRMVYHSKKPPVKTGDSIIVLRGFFGQYYGFLTI